MKVTYKILKLPRHFAWLKDGYNPLCHNTFKLVDGLVFPSCMYVN